MSILKYILIFIFIVSSVSAKTMHCDICRESLNNKFRLDAWGNKFHDWTATVFWQPTYSNFDPDEDTETMS